jgi:hypothetical protein
MGHAALTLLVARCKAQWLPYAVIINWHLVADQMWKYPRTLFFPLSGRLDSWKFMGTPAAMLDAYAEIVKRPAIAAGEIVGLALLVWVAYRTGLYRKRGLKQLVRTGRPSMAQR